MAEIKQETSFRKFGLPVIKLDAVSGIVGGAVGATAAFTKERIDKNIYEQKLKSYVELGEKSGLWTRGSTDNFNIVENYKQDNAPNITEYMAYCDTSVGITCNGGEDASTDLKGLSFSGSLNVGGYGDMKLQVMVNKDGIIQGYSHLGFISSFGNQTDIIKADMRNIIGKPITAPNFTSGASVVISVGAVNTLLGEMANVYNVLAAVAIEDVLKDQLATAVAAGDLTDAEIDNATVKEETTIREGGIRLLHKIQFANGDWGFHIRWNNDWTSTETRLFIRVAADGTISKYTKVTTGGYYGTAGVCGAPACGDSQVHTWLQNLVTTDITTVTAGTVTGGTAPDTQTAWNNLATLLVNAWNGRA